MYQFFDYAWSFAKFNLWLDIVAIATAISVTYSHDWYKAASFGLPLYIHYVALTLNAM